MICARTGERIKLSEVRSKQLVDKISCTLSFVLATRHILDSFKQRVLSTVNISQACVCCAVDCMQQLACEALLCLVRFMTTIVNWYLRLFIKDSYLQT